LTFVDGIDDIFIFPASGFSHNSRDLNGFPYHFKRRLTEILSLAVEPAEAFLNCLRLVLIYDLLTEVNELCAINTWKTHIIFTLQVYAHFHQLGFIWLFGGIFKWR